MISKIGVVVNHYVLHLFICVGLVFGFFTSPSWAAKDPSDPKKGLFKKDEPYSGRGLKKSAYAMTSADKKKRSKALAHYTMGIIYDNEGKTGLAIREYKKTLKYNPNSTIARLRLGAAYLISGKDKKAVKELEFIKKVDPRNSQARFLLALIHASGGNFVAAQKEYEKVIEYNPDDLRALSSLADLFVVQEKMEKAAFVYKKLLEKKENPIIHFNLGIIYNRLGTRVKALREIEMAIALRPEYLEAHIVRGVLLEERGAYEKAIESYKNILKKDPLNLQIYARLAHAYTKMGKKNPHNHTRKSAGA